MNGRTPAEVFADGMREKRALPADQIELELCRRVRVTVGRNGVSTKLHGATLAYEHVTLDSMSGQAVDVVLDDDDLSRAGIYRLDGSRLCVASAMASVPVNAVSRSVAGSDMRMADDLSERMHRRAIEAQAASPVATPDVIQPVRTPDATQALRIAGDDDGDDDYPDFDYADYADVEPRRAVTW